MMPPATSHRHCCPTLLLVTAGHDDARLDRPSVAGNGPHAIACKIAALAPAAHRTGVSAHSRRAARFTGPSLRRQCRQIPIAPAEPGPLIPAPSFLGGFRTPALLRVGSRSVTGRHPKPVTRATRKGCEKQGCRNNCSMTGWVNSVV